MSDTTGLAASEMIASSSAQFVAELNTLTKPAIWPWLLIATSIFAAVATSIPALLIVVLVVGISLTVIFAVARARHVVTVDYEIDSVVADWHRELADRWMSVSRVGAMWRVATQGRTETLHHRKVNAGASSLVSRRALSSSTSPHKRLRSNLSLPTFVDGKQSITFMPDYILVRSGNAWSDIRYCTLQVTYHAQRFIEDGPIPRGAEQVDTTWRYVNKNGGPDRRFNDNRQLPILMYSEIEVSTRAGLRWLIQLSDKAAAQQLAITLSRNPETGVRY